MLIQRREPALESRARSAVVLSGAVVVALGLPIVSGCGHASGPGRTAANHANGQNGNGKETGKTAGIRVARPERREIGRAHV